MTVGMTNRQQRRIVWPHTTIAVDHLDRYGQGGAGKAAA